MIYKQTNLFLCYTVRSNSPLVKSFKLTTSNEDFEFKKLLINMVVILNRNPTMHEVCFTISYTFVYILFPEFFSVQLISNSRVVLALLSYIEPLPRKKDLQFNTFEWNIAQCEDLQLHALAALSVLLPKSLMDYFEYGIGTRLLTFFEWAINNGWKNVCVGFIYTFFDFR